MSMLAATPILLLYLLPIILVCYLMILGIKALKIYIAKNQDNYNHRL